MTTPNPGGRRAFDGPKPPLAPKPRVSMVPPIQPAPPAAVATEAPVFEYRKPRHLRGGWWRWARWVALGLALMVLVTVGWFAYKALNATHKIITRSNGGAPVLAGAVDPAKLKGEGDGRINILALGIGGTGHEAPNLSDTILVVSIDPRTKDAAMLSIPRDLYVKMPAVAKYNTQYSKINAANAYGGPEFAARVVSSVIGVPIHYYTLIDFSGFRRAIDAVGGVDITVPKAIHDPSYPCDDERGGYCPFSISTGPQHMNGVVALRYARSRHSTSDFDRAMRQQMVITALRTKALQLSTLTNPVKLTALIDTIGGHVKTDMQPKEITKLASIVKDIDTSKMVQKVLDTSGDDALLVGGINLIPGAGYIELPKAGNFDYRDIQDFVKNVFVDHYITDENARIEIQNGSGVAGVAGTVAKSLKAAHYNVADATNADTSYAKTVIYDYTGSKKPYTINYLERRFGVKAQRAAPPTPSPAPSASPAGSVAAVPEIRIILGSDYKAAGSTQ